MTGRGEMLNPEDESLADAHLTPAHLDEIERVVNDKIRARQERELLELLQEVTAEIRSRSQV